MASCENGGDCRDGYSCLRADALGEIVVSGSGDQGDSAQVKTYPLARNLDRETAKFCTVDQ
jgi:hypothetical protein